MHLTHNGPIVKGAKITFNATVYYGYHIVENENLRYEWMDNGFPPHSESVSICFNIPSYLFIIIYVIIHTYLFIIVISNQFNVMFCVFSSN